MQRLHGSKQAKEFQPLIIVHEVVTIGQHIRVARLDSEILYVGDHGASLAECLCYVRDLPIQPLARDLKREMILVEESLTIVVVKDDVDTVQAKIYLSAFKSGQVEIWGATYKIGKPGNANLKIKLIEVSP